MKIITELPIGRLEVDPSTCRVVHVYDPRNGYLISQEIVHWGIIYKEDGVISQGYTFSCSVNEDLKLLVVNDACIFINKGIVLFDAKTGNVIWD